ncbi:sugar phosphate isomerase/epimerase family protein [Brachybacterium hainanense]|uniref:Sugar phosphate isomerase/epimerase family protein n=1 Tax=Brachybacterium hainanense TaxID=1541174 RepID=A0ABV6R846_9MICO
MTASPSADLLSPAERVGVSTITFRHRSLAEALRLIAEAGASRIDLGAIPAVTDHVPVPFTGDPVAVAAQVSAAGLAADAVNADPGDLNDPDLDEDAFAAVIDGLAALAAACGGALIVPAGRADWEPFSSPEEDLALIVRRLRLAAEVCSHHGTRLLVEVLHHRRYIHTTAAADALLAQLGPEEIGLLLDVSHVVASGEDPAAWAARQASRIERVHLRDAVPGDLNLAIGAGQVDFPAVIQVLERHVPGVRYVLELETRDVQEEDREADLARSLALIRALLPR